MAFAARPSSVRAAALGAACDPALRAGGDRASQAPHSDQTGPLCPHVLPLDRGCLGILAQATRGTRPDAFAYWATHSKSHPSLTPASPQPHPSPSLTPASPQPQPSLTPASPQPHPSPSLTPASPQPQPHPSLTPASPQPHPSPSLTPASPQPHPSLSLTPASPQPHPSLSPASPQPHPSLTPAPASPQPHPSLTGGLSGRLAITWRGR